MRWIAVSLTTVAVIFALGFLYIGSTHRDRCIKDGNVGCSILPWSGQASSGGDTGNVVIP